MANETGFTLIIDDKMLNKLSKADEKIEQLQKTSDKTSSTVISAFKQMTESVDPFIGKLNEANGLLSKLKSPKISFDGFKGIATDGEKAAKSVADISVALNKAKSSPIDDLNKKIASLKDLLVQSTKAAEDYANKMSSIKSTGSGTISGITIKEGNAGKSLIPQIQAEIAALEQEKKSLLSSQAMWTQRVETLNGSSLATQRQVSDMAKLNDAFRNGQSEMQKQAKAQDDLAKAAERTAKSVEKQAASEAKKAAQSQTKGDNAATRAVEQYNNALNKSEVTIANRARKIEALANAERALTKTGRGYTSELRNIRSETERLNKANTDAANSTNKIKSSHSDLVNTAGQLKRQLGLLFSLSQIEGYIMKMVSVRGEFELQQKSLQAILQNKDEANAVWDKTVALAVKSPFTVKELVTYTKQLAAYRVESDKLYETTKMLADVSAGLGVGMDRLILVYGQVKSANYLRGSEVRQFTEAGVNVVGELAKSYSELEGRMVSVGEVQSRITKRMVSFGDVEDVFKRITSAGGIFYKMQELQAETLKGMMSNLTDNFDLMFNEIGKANDGVLKGFVEIMISIVSNWRYLAIALNTSATVFAIYVANAAIASIANKAYSATAIEATIKQGGLTAAIAKTTLAMKSSFIFLSKNPWVLIATVVAGAIYYFVDLVNKLDETTKSYDILNNKIDEQKKNLELLTGQIEKQVKAQDEAEKSLSNIKEGTEEYKEAEDKANKEREKTQKLLGNLKTQYPEVYAQMMLNKKGVESLREEQERYNEELERTSTLNYLMKKSVPLWGEDFKTSGESYDDSFSRQSKAIERVKTSYSALVAEMNYYINTEKKIPKKNKDDISSIVNSSKPLADKTHELIEQANKLRDLHITSNRMLNTLKHDAISSLTELRIANKDRANEMTNANENYELLRDNALKEAGVTLEEFNKLSAIQQKGIGDRMASFIKSAAGSESLLFRSFIKTRVKQDLKIDISYDEKKLEKELDQAQARLKVEVDKYNSSKNIKGNAALKLPVVTSDTSIEEYRDKMAASGKALVESAEENERSVVNLDSHIDNVKEAAVSLAKAAGKEQVELAKLFGYIDNKALKTGESEYEKKIKSQLELLKKLQSQYEKLKKSQKEEDVTKNLQTSFGDVYGKVFGKPITSIKFDKASIAAEAENIGKSIGGKSAEALSESFNKYASELKANMVIEVSTEKREAIKSQIKDLFRGYEVSIKLEKLKLPTELIQNLFNVDIFNLDELRERAKPYLDNLKSEGLESIKIANDIENEITQFQEKELDDRLVKFAEYLEKATDNVKRVQDAGSLEISFATKLSEEGRITAEQYSIAIRSIIEKTNRDISSINIDKFKNSNEYIQAMGDLSAYSAKELSKLADKIQNLINESAGVVPASDLKVYADALAKIEQQSNKIKNPFDNNYFKQVKDLSDLEKKFGEEKDHYNSLLKQQELETINLADAERKLAEAKQLGKEQGTSSPDVQANIQSATENVKTANQALNNTNSNINVSQGKMSSISGMMGQMSQGASSAMAMVDMIVKGIYQSIKATIDLFNDLKDLAESGGSDVDSGGWREASQAMEVLGGVNENVMGAWEDFKSGNIAGAFQKTVSSIVDVFTTLNRQHDKRRQQSIEKEEKRLKQIERAYQKLEKAIDAAYSMDALNKSNNEAQANIDEQIKSHESMMNSERDKKKSDDEKIKEYQNSIEDLQDKKKELAKEKISDLGGFGTESEVKSAASEYVEAWLSAFNETGDGLSGLQGKMDDFIKNAVNKQMLATLSKKFITPILESFNDMFGDNSLGGEQMTAAELAAWKNLYNENSKAFDEKAKEYMAVLNLSPTGDGAKLSGLQKGIQGVTEDTAQVLESLLNSMRFFVADSNLQLKNIYAVLTNPDIPNPILSELRMQTSLVKSIYDLFNDMTAPNTALGGRGLKVCI